MKDKIVELGIKRFQIKERPGQPQVIGIRLLEEHADEILALIAKEIRDWRTNMGAMHDMYESHQSTGTPTEKEIRLQGEPDHYLKCCDCRDCKPKLWMFDTDRDIWIKKAI